MHTGLQDLELDIDHLTGVKDDQELQLEKGAEALRTIKAQNEQVMMGLTTSRPSQLHHDLQQDLILHARAQHTHTRMYPTGQEPFRGSAWFLSSGCA